jgi:hypothetical protein
MNDDPDAVEQKNEAEGDSFAANALYRAYCEWHTDCKYFGSPFLPGEITQDWTNARFYWQVAAQMTHNPIKIAILKTKLSPDSSFHCNLDKEGGIASCDPVPWRSDLVTIGEKDFARAYFINSVSG